MTGRSGKGTARQTIRIEESLWERFATASENAGSDRSSVLRDFIRWYVREPRTKMPRRPATSVDTAADEGDLEPIPLSD